MTKKGKIAVSRQLHKIDAAGQSVGRLATQIAIILRGKNKPEFIHNIDGGDIVEVSNVEKMKFTGDKLKQKIYYHYSGYPGGMKKTKMADLAKTKPGEILTRAVQKMLPPVKFRREIIKRLVIK